MCLVQMVYLNRALDVFNTAVVTPLLYVIFTGCVILASAVLFREWTGLGAEDVIGNICGLLIIVAGIFLVQAFRDVNVSLHNLPRARKDVMSPSSFTGAGDSDSRWDSHLIDVGPLGVKKSVSVHNGFAGGSFHVRTSSYS
jgi:magnesium transporter